ncbi:hypothetical protein FRACYDRAFT_263652 [Fragilariopsis cylindrus CCMP1102]|uniref:Uncharacterized protein n=1 Tax=Fragilariopsis cylindrus CCMP1102 TaxID=635003 RepID=A0A1E7EZ88_9STRA|nr:hypothetical protein FRACYDRAFT_263652 [Fragilariopsis cylindrus CCMP1102]|eukprot:OEU11262.1 hypothetical protein FRACYDRAFT_263652 [Fragilariopsis cylindrus CCMP1102]
MVDRACNRGCLFLFLVLLFLFLFLSIQIKVTEHSKSSSSRSISRRRSHSRDNNINNKNKERSLSSRSLSQRSHSRNNKERRGSSRRVRRSSIDNSSIQHYYRDVACTGILHDGSGGKNGSNNNNNCGCPCSYVHIGNDNCPGTQQLHQISREIAIENKKFSKKICQQIRKRLVIVIMEETATEITTSTITSTSTSSNNKRKKKIRNGKGKVKRPVQRLFLRRSSRRGNSTNNINADNEVVVYPNHYELINDDDNKVDDSHYLVIYDYIRSIYISERYMVKHANPHDVYFDYPDHPGTKAFIRAVQQVIVCKIRDHHNTTNTNTTTTTDTVVMDVNVNGKNAGNTSGSSSNDYLKYYNNNEMRTTTTTTYRQIKDKLYDSKYFIGKAVVVAVGGGVNKEVPGSIIQASKEIRNTIFKARYEYELSVLKRKLIEEKQLLLLQQKQDHNDKVALARPIPGTIYSGIIKQWIRWLFNKCYSLLKKLYEYCCHYFTTKICSKKKTTTATATATATTTNSSSTNSTIGSSSNSSSSRRNCNWNCNWRRNCNIIKDRLLNAITISYCGSDKTKEPIIFILICLLFGMIFGIIYAIYKSIVLYGISFL